MSDRSLFHLLTSSPDCRSIPNCIRARSHARRGFADAIVSLHFVARVSRYQPKFAVIERRGSVIANIELTPVQSDSLSRLIFGLDSQLAPRKCRIRQRGTSPTPKPGGRTPAKVNLFIECEVGSDQEAMLSKTRRLAARQAPSTHSTGISGRAEADRPAPAMRRRPLFSSRS
jgi:hypothetical protein